MNMIGKNLEMGNLLGEHFSAFFFKEKRGEKRNPYGVQFVSFLYRRVEEEEAEGFRGAPEYESSR